MSVAGLVKCISRGVTGVGVWRAKLSKTGDTGVQFTNADADTTNDGEDEARADKILVGKMLVKYIFNFQKS